MVNDEAQVEECFPQSCGRIVLQEAGRVVMAPDTPESMPGNGQYFLLTRVNPHEEQLQLEIEWPQRNETDLPGFYYAENENFEKVLPEVFSSGHTAREVRGSGNLG